MQLQRALELDDCSPLLTEMKRIVGIVMAVAGVLALAIVIAVYWIRSSTSEAQLEPEHSSAPIRPAETETHVQGPAGESLGRGMEGARELRESRWGLPDLSELAFAAKGGDANAQFQLSVEMRRCYVLESAFRRSPRDDQSTPSQKRYWQRCLAFDAGEPFESLSKRWAAQANENGSLHARALQLAEAVDPSDAMSRRQTERQLRSLIESQDSFVYYVVYLLKTNSLEDVEGNSWKLLSCTSPGAPAWLCVQPESETEAYCGDDGCAPAEYHEYTLSRHPGIYDQIRARAEQLRGMLDSKRFDELDLGIPATNDPK